MAKLILINNTILNLGVLLLALFLLCLIDVGESKAESLYVVRGKRGVVTFTTRKPISASNFSMFRPSRGPSFSRFYSIRSPWSAKPISSEFDDLINATAIEQQLDPALVKAVVHVESNFDPRATSPKGAMGLMQLMPGTAQRFGVNKPYKAEDNVRGGVTYLKMLHDRYSGDTRLALAAYNAGEGSVDPIMDIPPFRETQTYVRRVLKMREVYTCVFAGRKNCSG